MWGWFIIGCGLKIFVKVNFISWKIVLSSCFMKN